jgi:hypothetical protein
MYKSLVQLPPASREPSPVADPGFRVIDDINLNGDNEVDINVRLIRQEEQEERGRARGRVVVREREAGPSRPRVEPRQAKIRERDTDLTVERGSVASSDAGSHPVAVDENENPHDNAHEANLKDIAIERKAVDSRSRFHGHSWDLSRANDVTVHLELDIADDLGSDLEEFCRLGRLGNFRKAIRFFEDKFKEQIENPYVILQYASILLEMGDYKNANKLELPSNPFTSTNDILWKNWTLVQIFCKMHSEGLYTEDERLAEQCTENLRSTGNGYLGSTEVYIPLVHEQELTSCPVSNSKPGTASIQHVQ